MKKYLNIIIVAVLLIGAAGSSFVVGMKFQEHRQTLSFGRGGAQLRNNANRTNVRPVTGQIIAVDDKSITIKQQDGSSRIVILSDKTTISKATDGVKTDLTKDTNVMVVGQVNADGSVTAQNIQLNPQIRGAVPVNK